MEMLGNITGVPLVIAGAGEYRCIKSEEDTAYPHIVSAKMQLKYPSYFTCYFIH